MWRLAHLLIVIVVLVAPLRLPERSCQCPPTCPHALATKTRRPCHMAVKKHGCHGKRADDAPSLRGGRCYHGGEALAGLVREPAVLTGAALPVPAALTSTVASEDARGLRRSLRPPPRPPTATAVG